MNPVYFHTRLTCWEANDFVQGLAKRERSVYKSARLICDVIAKIAGNENGAGIEFDWEKEEEQAEVATDEDYARILEESKKRGWIV